MSEKREARFAGPGKSAELSFSGFVHSMQSSLKRNQFGPEILKIQKVGKAYHSKVGKTGHPGKVRNHIFEDLGFQCNGPSNRTSLV
uniref:Uncharacterized protein n=1 Tax=Romanomermis culicivorax TaxID=13658 RepID=A0A915K5F1_ROMCU